MRGPFGTLCLPPRLWGAFGFWLAGDMLICWEQSFVACGGSMLGDIGLWPLASGLWPAWPLASGLWPAGDKLICWELSLETFGDSSPGVPSGHFGFWLAGVVEMLGTIVWDSR